ncbi:MerR family transcriptional regulator [Lacticaseibacillus saniviri]
MTKYFSTKEVAQQVGMSVSQIHYYDHLGLIPALSRTDTGYRQFTEQNVTRLKDLKQFIASGMPLKQIRQLTDLVEQGKKQTLVQQRTIIAEQIRILERKQTAIDDQIEFLTQFIND